MLLEKLRNNFFFEKISAEIEKAEPEVQG